MIMNYSYYRCPDMSCGVCYPAESGGKPQYIPIIEGVLDIMDEDRWIKGTLSTGSKYCLLGFVEIAMQNMRVSREYRGLFHRFIDNHCIRKYGRTVPNFNDASETTYEDVQLFVKSLISECQEA